MRKNISVPICSLLIIIALFLPLASAFDRSEYDSITNNIETLKVQFEEAKENKEWGAAYSIKTQIEELENRLKSDELKLISEIAGLEDLVSGLKSIISESAGSRLPELTTIETKIESAKNAYDSGDMALVLSTIKSAKTDAMNIFESTLVVSLEAITIAEEKLENKDYLSPEPRRLLKEARDEIALARQIFSEAQALSGNEAEDKYKEAYEHAINALDLLDRAEFEVGPVESIIRWALVLIPLVVITALIIFFYKKFTGQSLEVSISKNEILPGKFIELTKTIVVRNTENEIITAIVRDQLPPDATLSVAQLEPKIVNDKLEWRIVLKKGQTDAIAYTLVLKPRNSGEKTVIPSANVQYMIHGTRKILTSNPMVVVAK